MKNASQWRTKFRRNYDENSIRYANILQKT